MKRTILLWVFAIIFGGLAGQTQNNLLETINYRALSPYRAGSWISAIAVPETDNPDFN